MRFLNSLSIRIPLAVIGGILHSLLSYSIVILIDLSSDLAILAAAFVFFFYLGSRLLILFSRIDSSYYSKRRTITSTSTFKKDTFDQTVRWVGKLYHCHDIVLFAFLIAISVAFLVSLGVDGLKRHPIGNTSQNLWEVLTSLIGK